MELRHGDVTTSVQKGAGHGGDITLHSRFLVQENGYIKAKAYEGDGGNIQIHTTGIFQAPLLSPRATNKLIDASSKLGKDGIVEIHSPEGDINSGLVILTTDFMDKAALDTAACSAEERVSRFFMGHSHVGVPSGGRGDYLASGW